MSNAAQVKQADGTHQGIDSVVAWEMQRENLRLLENANVLVLSKFNEWRYVDQEQYDHKLLESCKR